MDTAISTAVTKGVKVEVATRYIEDQSSPMARRFVFAYTIRITNEGPKTVHLISRHWVITDAEGEVEEVKGDGVVGVQPTLEPSRSFEYTSGCVLETPQGTMHGTYQMTREGGERFDAEIAPFLLAVPNSLN
jgi:ApaG protein